MYRERGAEIYFKELTHVIVQNGKSKTEGQASRAETQGGINAAVQIQRQSAGQNFLPQLMSTFFLLKS